MLRSLPAPRLDLGPGPHIAGHPRAALPSVLALLAGCLAAPLGAGFDPDLLGGLRARNIGPAGMSGRVAAVDAVIADPEVIWIGAATGGVWRSRDGGLAWEPLFDEQPVHAIGALAIDQRHPDRVWVGTGEANLRNSASVGNGVYLTRDGGETWQHLGLEATEHVHRILLHPADPQTAYVCATGKAWGENAERGVFKTIDGGTSWQKVLYVDPRTGCGDLAMDPANPDHLLAGMWQFRRWPWSMRSGGPGSGLFVTWDGGRSWRRQQQEDGLPAGELGRIGLAFAPSDPRTVYALVEAEQSALLRSLDGGRSWSTINDRPSIAPRPFYFQELRVDPQTPGRVYSVDYLIRVSEDGGKSFRPLPGGSWEDIHGDYHALWIHPRDPDVMVAGNDGGVAISRDRGASFRFVETLPLAQFYHLAVDLEQPYNVYGGLQDNGSWRGPNEVWQEGGIRNHHWRVVGDGDGFEVLPDPEDPLSGYSLWQGGNLMRWDLLTGATRGIKPAAPGDQPLRCNWNAGLAIDPFAPATLYLGCQLLLRSTDRGETWTPISPDLTTNNPLWQQQATSGGLTPDVTHAENFTTIVAVAPSPLERGVLWVGTDDGRVQLSRDGGASWTALEGNLEGVPANTWVPHVEASRHHAGTAYVVLDNHRRSDWTPYVYKTTNYGSTWTRLAAGVRGYALVLVEDPVDPELLFLGTELGLYASNDGGSEWTHLREALPTASVMDLAIHPREHDLVIGTHGRGVWVIDDVSPLRNLSRETLEAPLHFFPPPPAQQHWRAAQDGGFGFGAGEFRGENPPYGALLTYSLHLPELPLHDEEKERQRREAERRAPRAELAARLASEERAAGAPATTAAERAEGEADEDEPPAAGGTAVPGAKSGDAAGQEQPKVEIEVRDAAGKVVRRFRGPAVLGINRVAWDLAADPGRELPRDPEDAEDDEDDDERSGPELPPGAYSVTLRFRGHEASQPVEVVADPRSRNTPQQWQARWEAIQEGVRLQDVVADAIWRLRQAREDVEVVRERASRRLRNAGERDDERIAADPLVAAGAELVERLDTLERTLWAPPEARGILPETDALAQLWYASWYPQSSWDPPSPTHLAHLAAARRVVERAVAAVEEVIAGPLRDFRRQADAAGAGPLGGPPAP